MKRERLRSRPSSVEHRQLKSFTYAASFECFRKFRMSAFFCELQISGEAFKFFRGVKNNCKSYDGPLFGKWRKVIAYVGILQLVLLDLGNLPCKTTTCRPLCDSCMFIQFINIVTSPNSSMS